ncbi:MAG: DNA primase [Brevinematales bacterium]|nr:DNA primase [Brevinematales bacterium]
MIPEHIRDRILSKVSLVDIIEKEGIKVIKRGRQYTALCPFHKEKTPSFSVNNEEGVYYCFGCHAKGNAITFLREYKGFSYLEAMEYLASLAHEDIKPYLVSDKTSEGKKQDYISLYQKAVEFYQRVLWSQEGEDVRSYLMSRGLQPETLKAFRIGYSHDPRGLADFLRSQGFEYAHMVRWGLLSTYEHRDRFAGRILYPIYDREGSPIAFGARLFAKEDGPKYINSPDTPYFKKSDVLYGFFQAKGTLMKEKQALIVEGYMDVIGLHQAGITSAVAPLGTALTSSQLQLLGRYVDTLVLLFDGDAAGLQAASRSLDLIVETNMESRVVILPDGVDPDEMVLKEGKENFVSFLQKNAMDPLDFKWKYLHTHQMKDQPRKKQVEEMFRFIQKISLQSEQVKALQKLAAFLQVGADIVYKDFRQWMFRAKNTSQTPSETVSLSVLASQLQTEEHERMMLATLIVLDDVTVLEAVEKYIDEDMFTCEKYREWYRYLLTEKPSAHVMYDLVKEDNALYEKLFALHSHINEEGIMEQVYTFLLHYFQKKHHECTVKIEEAERKGEGFETLKNLQYEKSEWQKKIDTTRFCLEELHTKALCESEYKEER